MRAALLRAAGAGGWGGGLRFPCAETTGANVTGPLTAVPGTATSGTGWTWVGGASNEVKITTANANVSGLDVAGGLLIQANGVTVSNCKFAGNCAVGGTSAGTTLSNIQVTHKGSTAAGITLQSGTSATRITRCTVSGQDPGIGRLSYCIQDSSSDPSTLVEYCNLSWARIFGSAVAGTWRGCYMHDAGFVGGDHTDGIDVEGTAGHSLAITGNTILVALSQTAPIHMNPSLSAITNVTVSGNLLAGGGFCIYCANTGQNFSSTSQGIAVTDNWFSTMYYALGGLFGAGTQYSTTATGNAWTGNRWLDGASAGQAIPHP